MRDTMSIIGLYSYDPTIFEAVTAISATVADADGAEHTATIAADKIVDNILSGCAELEILYTQPDYLKFAIANWWERKAPIYTALLETTLYKYDAIANYDRREEWTDNNKVISSTAEHYAAGYNASEPTLAGRDTGSGESAASHSGRVSGNIGVMSTQELIARQRAIVDFDVIAKITEDFKATFCLAIY